MSTIRVVLVLNFLLLPLGVTTVSCGGASGPPAASNTTVATEVAARAEWQAQRLADLRSEEGWLAVVGLHWLQQGEQTVGWSEEAKLTLTEPPVDAPALLARIRLLSEPSSTEGGSRQIAMLQPLVDGGRVRQTVASEDGEETVIKADRDAEGWWHFTAAAGEPPLVFEYGSFEMFAIERGGELALRVRNRASTARERLVEIPLYDYEASWVIEGRFEPAQGVREVAIDNSTDHDYPQRSIGRLLFERDGQAFAMELVGSDVSQPQLLMVGDTTSGEATYGGGRYLYVEVGENGNVEADFNRLYNPPCVFTPFATCPLPPTANRLPFAVDAGERVPLFADGSH